MLERALCRLLLLLIQFWGTVGLFRTLERVYLRYSTITFLESGFVYGPRGDVQVGHCTEVKIACSVSEEQQPILYCYSELHQGQLPVIRGLSALSVATKHFIARETPPQVIILCFKYLATQKHAVMGGGREYPTKHLYL